MAEKIKQLNLAFTQIYNADEPDLYCKMLIEKTLDHFQKKKTAGQKLNDECLTMVVCCNADSAQKFELLVVGKLKNSRVFESVSIPVEYKSSSNAWMTKKFFWIGFIFQSLVKFRSLNLPEKDPLIVDIRAMELLKS